MRFENCSRLVEIARFQEEQRRDVFVSRLAKGLVRTAAMNALRPEDPGLEFLAAAGLVGNPVGYFL